MILAADIQHCLETGLPNSQVTVTGDDGRHFDVLVISADFAGKKEIERHRMVYAVLGDKMKQEIHALSIKTQVL